MATNLDVLVDITERIERGELDKQLDALATAIAERKSTLRGNVKLDDFQVGDKVIINERCGTRYLRGETGSVVGIRRTKLTIQFDNPKGRFVRKSANGDIYSSDVVVPIEIVDKQ